MRFTIILILLSASTAFSFQRGDGYEYLTPQEKDMLEKTLEQSPQTSLCPRTVEFANKYREEFLPRGPKADFILVDKQRRLIHLLRDEQVLATYRMALGGRPVGHKVMEGDERTPEGLYFFDMKNERSDYHLSLRINYPNSRDLRSAKEKGISDPGKDIMIHGLPNSWIKRKLIRHPRDWTRGCMAVTSSEVEEIFASVELGTLIEICP
ncbi:MAG: L,D-transpeptidase family protein [Bdellovibrio sp.]|nr:L,D-transpeptidase family protein [Bdellovibrio sp.]